MATPMSLSLMRVTYGSSETTTMRVVRDMMIDMIEMDRYDRVCEDITLLKEQYTAKLEEDKKKPLTDEKLAKILKEKGYPIARRTVAKYREQLEFPVARLRKEI